MTWNFFKTAAKWLGEAASCDICGELFTDYFIDGYANVGGGGWCLTCPSCHEQVGRGLGEGRGQKYDAKTKELVAGQPSNEEIE